MCVGVSVCARVCVGREGAEQTLPCMQETVAQSPPHHQQRCDQPRNFTPASEYKLGELEEKIHSWGRGGATFNACVTDPGYVQSELAGPAQRSVM